MKFLDWYLKIGAVSALIGASMEVFMIHTGFLAEIVYKLNSYDEGNHGIGLGWIGSRGVKLLKRDGKVTVLESEKRAWESTPEAQAIRDALNPWRERDDAARKSSCRTFERNPNLGKKPSSFPDLVAKFKLGEKKQKKRRRVGFAEVGKAFLEKKCNGEIKESKVS
ncbi:hypothetical protein ZIOFF_037589 [Zingiber officinale]|uniref:Uncharacterized protein n=1 Tax=Zingiber officinale TaxID=94328 RepID=A0A8J5GG67_ZINOF|nr:hypothetical protein ZIOFF_037589 [Zingiber officinale]